MQQYLYLSMLIVLLALSAVVCYPRQFLSWLQLKCPHITPVITALWGERVCFGVESQSSLRHEAPFGSTGILSVARSDTPL